MFVTNIEFIGGLGILLFSLVLHENAHARAAYYLGDPTAKDMGRFSFNPLKHLTLIGLLLPIGLYLINGPIFTFAKPVRFNPSAFNKPQRDMILVGLAGPFVNFILAIIAFLLYNRLTILPATALLYTNKFFEHLGMINLVLGAFNLIPIPPLDGSIVFMSGLIDKKAALAEKLSHYGVGLLIFLIIVLPLIGTAYNQNYHIIGRYIIWFANKFIAILSPLGAW